MTAGLAVALALLVVASDLWAFIDARRWSRAGTPVVLRIGSVGIESPAAWFVACLVLWIFFFPTYVAARRG
jgi:hypothetical protein